MATYNSSPVTFPSDLFLTYQLRRTDTVGYVVFSEESTRAAMVDAGAGGGLPPAIQYYKMGGKDDGDISGYHHWVVTGEPDFSGEFATPTGNLSSIFIAARWR